MKTRLLALSFAGLTFVACNCNNPKPQPTPTLKITAPSKGATLKTSDDKRADLLDLQIDVAMSTTSMGAGTLIKVQVDAQSAVDALVGADGNAVAKDVTLTAGSHTLKAAAQLQGGQNASDQVTVTVNIPSGPRCVLHDPLPGSTLKAADDKDATAPGLQHDVEFDCGDVPDNSSATLTIGNLTPLPGIVKTNKVVFSKATFAEGSNTLVLKVTTPAVTASGDVTVDTGGCAASISPADLTTFNARGEGTNAVADRDPATAGEQVRLSLTTACPDGSTAQLVVDDQNQGAAVTVTGGKADIDTTLADGVRKVVLNVHGAAGKDGATLPVHYTVDSVIPTCVISAPLENAVLSNADDVDPGAAGEQVDVKAKCTDLLAGDSLTLRVTGPGGLSTTFTATLAGDLSATFAGVDLSNGSNTLVVIGARKSGTTATSPDRHVIADWHSSALVQITAPGAGQTFGLSGAPNGSAISVPFTISAAGFDGESGNLVCQGGLSVATFTVASGTATAQVSFQDTSCSQVAHTCVATVTTALGASFSSDPLTINTDNQAPVIGITDPVNGAPIPAATYNVKGSSTCVETGQIATLKITLGAATTTATAPVSNNLVTWASAALPDGQVTLVANVCDAAGNCSPDSPPIQVTVASNPATVAFTVPTTGQVWTAGDDCAGGTAGFQHAITATYANANSVTLEVGVPNGSGGFNYATQTAPTLAAGVATWGCGVVTLPEGSVRLRVTATNGVTPATDLADVTVNTGAPTCNISSPAPGAYLGLTARVGATSDAASDVVVASTAASVDLHVKDPSGSTSTLTQPVVGTGATFAAVHFSSLSGGVSTIDAACGTGASLAQNLTVDFSVPVLTFVTPVNGAKLNASNPNPVAVQLSATNLELGQPVTLVVDCGSPTTLNGTLGAGNTVSFAATLPDVSSCTLSATTANKAGNPSATAQIAVSVKRTAPTLGPILIKCAGNGTQPANNSLVGNSCDVSAAAGFQLDIIDSASLTDSLALSVNGTLVSTLVQAAATVTFPAVTLLGGSNQPNQLSITATDTFGNTFTQNATVFVDTGSPSLSITRPSSGQVINLLLDFDVNPANGIQFDVIVGQAGLSPGSALHICADVDQGSGACPDGLAGHFLLVSGTVQGATATISGGTFVDGSYNLIAYATNGAGNAGWSQPVPVVVDSVTPKTTSFALTNDANGDGILNAAELATAGNRAGYAIATTGGVGTVSVTSTPASAGGSGALASGTASFSSSGLPGDGTYVASAFFANANGNPNQRATPPVIVDTKANFTFSVDATAPTLSFTAPGAGATLNAASGTPSGTNLTFGVSVSTSAENGRTVTFKEGSTTVGSGTVNSGSASASVTLGQGAHTLTADVSDLAGNPAIQATVSFTVDSMGPTLAIGSPGSGASFSTGQFTVTVTYATSGNGKLESGRTIQIISSATGSSIGQGAASGTGSTDISVNAPNGAQTLTASAQDLAGNPGQSTPVSVTVTAAGCPIAYTAPTASTYYFNIAGGASPSGTPTLGDKNGNAGDGFQIDLTLATSDVSCYGKPVTVAYGATTLGPTNFDGTGHVTFANAAFADGFSGAVDASVNDGAGHVTHAIFNTTVDLTAPTISTPAPSAASVSYVAFGNTTANGSSILADKATGAPLQADFGFTATGAVGGTASLAITGGCTLDVGGACPSYTNLTAGQGVSWSVQIAQRANPTATMTLVDAAGNPATRAITTAVDVVPPAAPTLVAPTIVNERHADLDLAFTAVGDDGVAQGAAAAYDLRWALTPITDDTTFAAATPVGAVGAPGAPGGTDTLHALAIPPLNTYYFALKVRDAVQNWSALAAAPSKANLWTQASYAGENSNGLFGIVASMGSLNGDAFADLLVTDSSYGSGGAGGPGRVYVYFGQANLATMVPQTLDGAIAGEAFGNAASAMASVDKDDAIGDVVVGAPNYNSSQGRIFLYFGQNGGQLNTTPVEIRGAGAGGVFGKSVRDIGDIDGDGKADLAVGAPGDAAASPAGAGRFYILLSRTQANWRLENGKTIDTVANVITINGANANDQFGTRYGITTLGDLDGDGKAEFALPNSHSQGGSFVQYEPLFNAATVLAAPNPRSAALSPGQAFARLTDGGCGLDPTSANLGYGAFAFAAQLIGDAALDLVVANPLCKRVYVYQGDLVGHTMGTTPIQTIIPDTVGQTTSNFGYWPSSGDLNGDGHPDLVLGDNGVGSNNAFVYYGVSAGGPFAASYGTLLTGSGNFGAATAVGDMNNDGKPDLVIGAWRDVSGGLPVGVLRIWY